MKKLLLIALVILTVLVIGFTVYLFAAKPTPQQLLNQNTVDTSAEHADISPFATIAPIEQKKIEPTDVRTQVVTAIFSENYAPLAALMTEQVNVRIEGEQCCGEIIYPEAIKKLEELKGGGTWSFIDSDIRIGKLKTHTPNYYVEHDAIVGVSDSGYSVSFQLNDVGRIYIISIAKDYNTVLQ
jgi:hypothetical protein